MKTKRRRRRNPLPERFSAKTFLPAPLPPGPAVPPRISWDLLLSGKAPLVFLGEGAAIRPGDASSYKALLGNLDKVSAWLDLWIALGTRADIYVYDRYGERYRVLEVREDPGEETGILVLRHLGKKARSGDLRVDIHDAYGHVFPILSFKPTRWHP